MDKADPLRFLCTYCTARHDEFQCASLPNYARQSLRATITRYQAELDFWKTHFRVWRRDPKSACEGEFEPPAEGEAVNCSNAGERQPRYLLESRLAELSSAFLIHQRTATQFVDIRPGTEGLRPSTCNNQSSGGPTRHLTNGT